MIATHNLLDPIRSANPVWSILHSPNIIFATPGHMVFLAYPLIPWVGVTAAGYGLGQIYSWDAARRKTFLVRLGVGLIVGFVVLRAINIYGDPSRWMVQRNRRLHRALLPEHNEIPAVVAVSADDARPGAVASVGG